MAKNDLTAQRLREILRYDPDTGEFTRISSRHRLYVGSMAGSKMVRGGWQICVGNHRYSAHRLAWLYMTGEWPKDQVDHMDGDNMNNRFANLREATNLQNRQNQHRAHSNSKSGYLGVYMYRANPPRWCAQIHVNGKGKRIGLFKTPEEAHAAYVEAKRKLHPFGTL